MRNRLSKKLVASLCALLLPAALLAAPLRVLPLTVSGYSGTEALTNFPVLVRLSERIEGFSYGHCRPDGSDVSFALADGTVLDREIDTWNPAGESLVWVRIPVLENGLSFRCLYSDPLATGQPACQGDGSVWKPSGYIGVWHMNEVDARDSTGLGLDGTLEQEGASAAERIVAGRVGSAQKFVGKRIDCGTGLDPEFQNGLSTEGWVRPADAGSGAMCGQEGCFTPKFNSGRFTFTTPGKADHNLVAILNKDAWNHVVVTFEPSKAKGAKAYQDGLLKAEADASAMAAPSKTSRLFLGGNQWNENFRGLLDELRISKGVRSADWILGCHETVASEAFLTAGKVIFRGETLLSIAGDPVEVGAPEPTYGEHFEYDAGTDIVLTAPESALADGTTYRLAGYRMETLDISTGLGTNLLAEGTASSLTWPFQGHLLMTWLWETASHAVTAVPTDPADGSIEGAGAYAPGAMVTLTARPAPGKAFLFWEGEIPSGVDVTSPAISFPADRPRALTAQFGQVIHVSTTGDDLNDGTTWETALATVEAAVAKAADFTAIRIAAGAYEIAAPGQLTITKALTLVGCGETRDDVVLMPREIVKPAQGLGSMRFVTIDHEKAMVSNLTLTSPADPPDDALLCALRLQKGTVCNCTIRDVVGFDAPVEITGGTMTGCLLQGNTGARRYSSGSGHGGAARLWGGVMRDCIVRDNIAYKAGAGLYLSGDALVSNCTITNNQAISWTTDLQGAGVYMHGGILENSLVAGNGDERTATAGGVFMGDPSGAAEGTLKPVLRNCIVTGNKAKNCAGVTLESGEVLYNTIAGNHSVMASEGSGLFQTGGTARNNIIHGNTPKVNTAVSGGLFTCNVTDAEVPAAASVIVADPLFVDLAKGDYGLLPKSPALDAADLTSVLPTDYLGVSRPQGAAADIGALERVPGKGALQCGFLADSPVHLPGETARFFAAADGADLEGLVFSWNFHDDGTEDATGPEASWPDLPLGAFAVRLTVSNAAGEVATFLAPAAVTVIPGTTYVSLEGSAVFPYATPETATPDLKAAIDAVSATDEAPGKVVVYPGTYSMADVMLTIEKPVLVESVAGPETTIVKGTHPKTRRIMQVDHPHAVVSGLTLRDGRWDGYGFGDSGPGGLRLVSGMVTNCIIRDSEGNDDAGGVEVRGGVLADCRIFSNKAYRGNNGGAAKGGGIRLRGGLVTGCVISNNIAHQGWGSLCGGGLLMDGGILRDSLVEGNRCSSADDRIGAGIAMTDGLVEGCVIRGNRQCFRGAGVYQKGGVVRNCLFVGNEAKAEGAAIYLEKGILEFSTITGNKSTSFKGSGLHQAGGIARNNIIFDNGPGLASEPTSNLSYAGGSLTTNIVSPATAGTGNLDAVPLFMDAAAGDYRPGAGSPAIDRAAPVEGVVSDIAGSKRPKDGDGDGVAIPDIGCHEADGPNEGPLRCSFSAPVVADFDRLEATFTAHVAGAGSDGDVHYEWDFGGGTPASQATDSPVVEAIFESYGAFTVTLTVTAGGVSATSVLTDYIRVGASTIHVNVDGANIWPYETAENGATDIVEAIDSMLVVAPTRNKVIVHDGTYEIRAKWLVLGSPVELVSVNGPEKTILKAANPEDQSKRRVLYVANPGVQVSGFTMTGGLWDMSRFGDSGPGALRLAEGTVTDCIIRDNKGSDVAGGVEIVGGLMTDCLIYGNKAGRGNNPSVGRGGGVTITGGLLRHCVVSNNFAKAGRGGIDLQGGRVEDCLIVANRSGYTAESNRDVGGVRVEKGLLENCTIRGNVANGTVGGVSVAQKGIVRNCLLIENVAKKGAQAFAMTAADGSAYNCTVASNGSETAEGAVAAQLDEGTVANTIVYHNLVTDVATGAKLVSRFNCWPGVTGEGAVDADPSFRGPGDFHLGAASPCKNVGDNTPWTDVVDPLDLDGNKRILFRIVDLGCYENVAGNATILLLR